MLSDVVRSLNTIIESIWCENFQAVSFVQLGRLFYNCIKAGLYSWAKSKSQMKIHEKKTKLESFTDLWNFSMKRVM